jgi:hypothetical protein
MFNNALVEEDWTEVDGWDSRGHFTSTTARFVMRGTLQNAIYLAFCDCIDHGLHTLNDVGGVLLTHLEDIREGMQAKGTLCDIDDIDSFEGLLMDTSNPDGLDVDPDARKEMAMGMIDEWLEEEFPDEEDESPDDEEDGKDYYGTD